MKFTLSWLKQHLDTDATLEQISEKLTDIGLEVEEIEDKEKIYAPFKVAYIESAEPHPDADRLKVLQVKTADYGILQVVCGAPNAKAGMYGIFAPEGTYIPGLDVTLKKSKIRGIESNGMMVSEKEMCLSDEHNGIIELEGDYKIGTPMAEIFGLDDALIDIAITPNRADCAGVRGIARDLAAAGLGKLEDLNNTKITGNFDSPITVSLKFAEENKHHCPLFLGRYIKNVKNVQSPEWLRKKIESVGLRSISALVDITNYMTLDLNRPLHVYDADKLKGNINVRSAKSGEKLEALDGKNYELCEGQIVIADDSGAIALGGIIGGVETECTEDTVNVFLEAAYFDPYRIARTGRDLQIESDARYRFERGIDSQFTFDGIEIATRLITEICGGEVSNIVQAGDIPESTKTISFNPALVKKLTGMEIAKDKQKEILNSLGFQVKKETSESWQIITPSWRPDIWGQPDIVEEVARIWGYNNLPETSLQKDEVITRSAETKISSLSRKARIVLASIGLNECVTYSFMDKETALKFGANDNDNADNLTLINPISSDWNQMRPSILPNLIKAAANNVDKGYGNVCLFEVGPVFKSLKPEGQEIVASGIRQGQKANKHWSSPEESREFDLYDAKSDVYQALKAMNCPTDNLQIVREAPEYYHPGRSGVLKMGKNIIAYFGEIHPQIIDDIDVKAPVVGFEIFINNIPVPRKKKSTAKKLLQLSQFQPVNRDFAFIVDENVLAGDIERAAKSSDKKSIISVNIFDVYQGKGVEEGKKSIAINVTLQPIEKTFTDEEIEQISAKIIDNVSKRTGASLRA